MSINIRDQNFWSKLKLPFVSTPSGERMKSMWVSILPRKEPVITLHKNSDEFYGEDTMIRIIAQRIVYEVTEINKQYFCPLSNDDDENKDFIYLHNGIVKALLRKNYILGFTDLILMTDDNGKYKGIVIMDETDDESGDDYWDISYVCASKSKEGYGSKMIKQIQQQLEKEPKINYIKLISMADEFYKKLGFVHVYDHTKYEYNTIPCIKNAKVLESNKDAMIYCPQGKIQPVQPLPQPKFKVGDIVRATKDIKRPDMHGNEIIFMEKGEIGKIKSSFVITILDERYYGHYVLPEKADLSKHVYEDDIELVTASKGGRKTRRNKKRKQTRRN